MTDVATEHLCPRRAESSRQFPGPDGWDDRASLADGIGPCCSYCGSLNPDRFMELVREGWEVGPTDKSYKAYLGRPLADEERTSRKTQWSNGTVGQAVREAALASGNAPDEAEVAVDEYWRTHEEPLAGNAKTVAKFYYQHLTPEQQTEFIELYNSKAMKVGYPHHFYPRPYFCAAGKATQ